MTFGRSHTKYGRVRNPDAQVKIKESTCLTTFAVSFLLTLNGKFHVLNFGLSFETSDQGTTVPLLTKM